MGGKKSFFYSGMDESALKDYSNRTEEQLMDEGYYESKIDLMDELLVAFDDASEEDLREAAKRVDISSLYNIPMNSGIALYRARYASGFDDTDPDQFGYIHKEDAIELFRFNKAHEPVMYTATDPEIAYKEIERPCQGSFYLSVWNPENELNYSFLFNPMSCVPDSNAAKLAGIMTDKLGYSTIGYHYLGKIGQLMEHPGNNYSFSSELASRIFGSQDAIVSVSAKSEGKELNITFRKDAVDRAVKMHYVLLCRSVRNDLFDVQKIGLLRDSSVVWNDIRLDESSYSRGACANGDTDTLWKWIKQNPSMMNPAFIDEIVDNRVKMLVGGKDKPIFSYSYFVL